MTRNNFIVEILSSDDKCFRYTGIPTVTLLKSFFEWLEPASRHIKLWDGKKKLQAGKTRGRQRWKLTLFQEMILTLVRIRRGYDSHHMAYLFGVAQSHVCRIFTAWVNLLSVVMKPLLIWPSRDNVMGNLPDTFRRDYPRTRCIIDCTEFKVQKPFRPKAQRLTWSSYKHSNTFKLLVGISPTGTITFLSKLYPGSISDLAIVKLSGFVDIVEHNDDIMADRGFNIRHLLLPKKATLNMPAFTHGANLTKKAARKSRKIASVRIHVERAIQRMKTFKILSHVIPMKMRFLINQINTIVAVLCNMQDRLA